MASATGGNVTRSSLCMTGEVNLDTHWQQALASMLAAAGKNRTTILGFHAGTKSELLFARALRWLIGAFHKKSLISLIKKRGQL